MKILYGITKSEPFGGAQRYVFELAKEAQRRSHDVAVIAGKSGALSEKLEKENIRTIILPHLERDISFAKEIKSFFEIWKILVGEDPDVFHVNSSKMGGLGALAARIAGVDKIIFTAHGWPFWEERSLLSKITIRFFSWLTAMLAHKVIVVSNYDLKTAKRMPFVSGKVSRIYNGVDLDMEFGSGAIIRSAFGVGKKITGTIGELNRNKNHIALIEEARMDPGMHVAIVGEGELKDFLEKKIKEYKLEERVKLFGYLPREEVLKGFDIFALPSLKEGLPYAILEAKLAGLEIRANKVGGVEEALNGDIRDFSMEKMLEETFSLY